MINFIKGFIIGIGKIIPGVSGAMLATIMGVYDKSIFYICNFNWETKIEIRRGTFYMRPCSAAYGGRIWNPPLQALKIYEQLNGNAYPAGAAAPPRPPARASACVRACRRAPAR